MSIYYSRDYRGGATFSETNFKDSAFIQWNGRKDEFGKCLLLIKSIDLSRNELTRELPEALFDFVEIMNFVGLFLRQNALEMKKLKFHLPLLAVKTRMNSIVGFILVWHLDLPLHFG